MGSWRGVLGAAAAIALGACATGTASTEGAGGGPGDGAPGGGDASAFVDTGAGAQDSWVAPQDSGSAGDDSSAVPDTGDDAGDDGGGPTGDSGPGTDAGSCAPADACLSTSTSMGTIAGDSPSDATPASGTTSEWLRIDLQETDSSVLGAPMILTATLASPPGINFDLYAYLGGALGDIQCSSPKGQSTNPAGQNDVVNFQWGETGTLANGVDDSATVMLEVRAASPVCGGTWTLAVHGG